ILSIALLALFMSVLPGRSGAQELGRFEAGADYNFVHANAPQDQCGCFSMNGGDAWLGWHYNDHLALVGQLALQPASHINRTPANLTLTSFMAGPRLNFHRARRLLPFAQALFGVAHGSGLLTPQTGTGLSSTANSFALSAGGGLDFTLTRAISFRAIEADYF